jgi:hypothetical protein
MSPFMPFLCFFPANCIAFFAAPPTIMRMPATWQQFLRWRREGVKKEEEEGEEVLEREKWEKAERNK